MPYQMHDDLRSDEKLKNIDYGFFTVEDGSSSNGGYMMQGRGTRNVNPYAPHLELGSVGYDSHENVVANLVSCVKELGIDPNNPKNHCFFLTSNYAGMTIKKEDPNFDRLFGKLLIKVINNENILEKYQEALLESRQILKTDDYFEKFTKNNMVLTKADAIVLTNISREDVNDIFVGGFSADAHPIILLDDDNKVCAYVAATHHVLACQGIQQIIEEMVKNGSDINKIKIIIGPGLGKHSYEMPSIVAHTGQTIHDYFKVDSGAEYDDKQILSPVLNEKGEKRYLVDIKELVSLQATRIGLMTDNIFDMEIDTTGYDLYTVTADEGKLKKVDKEPEGIQFLYNSARRIAREQKQKDGEKNYDPLNDLDGNKYNPVARTCNGVVLRKRPRYLS